MTHEDIVLLKRRAQAEFANDPSERKLTNDLLVYIGVLERNLDLTQHWLTVRSAQWQQLDRMRNAALSQAPECYEITDTIGRLGASQNPTWPEVSQAAEKRHTGYLARRRSAILAIKHPGEDQ